MFEEMTFEYILNRVLKNISDDVDKRVGSVIYDAAAPCCLELSRLYLHIDEVLNETFADTASREYLIRRAKERGIYPKEASAAVVLAEFNKDVDIGSRFFIDGIIYYVSEKVEDGIFKMICETKGTEGHRHFGTLLPLENIEGLEKAKIFEVVVSGEDEEDTEVFRKRYFESFSALAFGGNKRDYIEKINLISGVGGCKVFPAFYGGGTVKLVIISSGYSKISDEFAKQIKQEADPFNNSGHGVGFAPIGHKVFVESVLEVPVCVDISLEISDDGDFEYIYKNSVEKISQYFYQLSKAWADCEKTEIVAMKIGTEIFDIKGVKNVLEISLDGGGAFLGRILNENEIPVIGDVSVNGEVLEGF